MWAFCKAILMGAGRSRGLSVRLCCWSCAEQAAKHVGFLCVCPILAWAFWEAVLKGSPGGAGRSSSFFCDWRESSKWEERQMLQLVKTWSGATLVKNRVGSSS